MKKLMILGVVVYGIYWAATSWMENLRGMAKWAKPPTETEAPVRDLASFGAVGFPTRDEAPAAAPAPAPLFVPIPARATSPRLVAEDYLEERKRAWGVQDYHELKGDVYESPTGVGMKYQVYQDNLPIVGMEIALDFNPDNSVRSLENGYRPVRKADLTAPMLTQSEILQRQGDRFKLDEESTAGVSQVLFLPMGSDIPEVSYVMPVTENGRASQVVFRASDGQILARQQSRSENFKAK